MMRRFAWCDTKSATSSIVCPCLLEHAARDLLRLAHGELEDRLAVLLDVVHPLLDRLVRGRVQAAARRHLERGPAAAVDLVLEPDDLEALFNRGLHDHGAGPVAEQHAGGAVGVVDDARHRVGADDQRALVLAGRDELARDAQREVEPGAGAGQVEPPALRGADLVLHQRRRAREEHVRRGRPDDDDIDVVGRQAGLREGLQRGLLPQIRRGHALLDHVPAS